MSLLKTSGINLDRKMLADLAAREPAAFAQIVAQAQESRS
jgi:ribosomal protein L20